MRAIIQRDHSGPLLRIFNERGEIAYLSLGLHGLCAQVEFPSDWHEQPRVWTRLGFGLFSAAFSLPWKKTVPDEGQCSGPTYGFVFFDDGLHLHLGKCLGRRGDPMKVIGMPWRWRHREHKILSEYETHPYRYTLKSGAVQERTATIRIESRLWTRPWLPLRRLDKYIDVRFNDEVGERSGSWKGGTIGCGYSMLKGETPLDTLRRMERDRKF